MNLAESKKIAVHFLPLDTVLKKGRDTIAVIKNGELTTSNDVSSFQKFVNSIREYISIAEDISQFTKPFDDRNPAKVNIQVPDSGKRINQIDALVRATSKSFIHSSSTQLLPFLFSEYHFNNTLKSEQNIFKLGGGIDYNTAFGIHKFLINFQLNNTRDYQSKKWSNQTSTFVTYTTPVRFSNKILKYIFPDTDIPIWEYGNLTFFSYQITSSLGLEYYNIYRSEMENEKGNVLFNSYKADLYLNFLNKLLQFSIGGIIKNNVYKKISERTYYYRKFGIAANFLKIFVKNFDLTLGFDLINSSGENLMLGIKKEKFWKLGFGIKI